MALQLKLLQNNCQNITKHLCRSQKKIEQLQEQLQKGSDSSDNSDDSNDSDDFDDFDTLRQVIRIIFLDIFLNINN